MLIEALYATGLHAARSVPVAGGQTWVVSHQKTVDHLRLHLRDLLASGLALGVRADVLRDRDSHTPRIAFRHLPPNFARFSYATERALFISAQLSSDAVSAL